MTIIKLCFIIWSFFFFYSHNLFCQLKIDKKSQLSFKQGKIYFEQSNYQKALEYFNSALERKFNLYTTPSLYMRGLCYFYLDNYTKAIQSFEQLLKNYPESIYVPEAQYHKALLMLSREETQTQKGGLYLLMNLAQDTTQDEELRQDVNAAIQHFLLNVANQEFLEDYLKIVRPAFRPLVLEALALKAHAQKNIPLLKEYIQQYQKENGKLSWRMSKLYTQSFTPVKVGSFNIAYVVHLGALNHDSSRAPRLAAQLIAGSLIAFEKLNKYKKWKIHVKVFDTQGEASTIEKILSEELPAFQPSLIIGDIFNNATKIIADYAEKNKILHIVPFSPSDELVEDRKYVLLANPSISTQTQALVQFAKEKLKLKKILIVSDGKKISDLLAQSFQKFCYKEKVFCSYEKISEEASKKKRYITAIAEEFRFNKFDGLYIPITNEGFLVDLLYQLKKEKVFPILIGTPDWSKFKNSTKKLLSEFEAITQELYFPRNDSALFQEFTTLYDQKFNNSPTRFSCQGFDIANYILKQLENVNDTTTLLQAIRKASPFKGLIQNYYFANANDNQSVQIIRYHLNGIEKLKRW
ncbi:MAG: tetratricopeptide repeat protein [Bacteroidia bacterium]|nr:tetratricopeptide repeat protein [Bacteroidia bacterium]MDW8159444.1 tetratricopeptide repeat protein [Bacteroidia bacterium]